MAICSRIWEIEKTALGETVLVAVMLLSLPVFGLAGAQEQSPSQVVPGSASSPQSPAQAPVAPAPGSETELQAAAPLRVLVGKSLLDQYHGAAQANFGHRSRHRRRAGGYAYADFGAWTRRR